MTDMALAVAATDIDLVANALDCDIDDFNVIEALKWDLSSKPLEWDLSSDYEQVDDLDFDIIKALDLDMSSTDDNLVDDLDCDIFNFDFIEALDLDMSSADDKIRRGACYSAIFSDTDIVSHCRHACEEDNDDSGAAAVCAWLLARLGDEDDCRDGVEEEAGSSPSADSAVTDDGSLTPTSGDEATAEAMSAYMAELERFLMEDDDDAPCGEQAKDLLGVVHDYFADDQLLVTAVVVQATGRAEPTDDVEEGENGVVLGARVDKQSASRKRARYE